MKRLLLLLYLCALPAFGQGPGVRFGDQQPVQSGQTPGGPIFTVPNATINFCNAPANGSPCTNKAATYTDQTLTTACPSNQQIVLSATNNCVATTDSFGNWGVWVSAGTYTFTIQLPTGGSMGPYTVTLASGAGANLLITNNVWSANNNFANGLQIYGLTAAPFTGAFSVGDCPIVSSVSPLIFQDGGTCSGGGGGSGTVVSSPQFQLFYQPNSGSSATAQGSNITTDATGNNLNVPGTATVTGNVTANANAAIKGPRPYVDVTAYGADPTNTSDSTTAIQNAINAACTAQSTVFFPPGAYKVAQPQSSNAPILVPGSGCNGAGRGLYMIGGGSNGTSGSFVPSARIFVNAGASPGLGPLLALGASGFTNGVGSSRIENLALQCYNQCVQELSGGDNYFVNDNMTVDAPIQTNCSSGGCTTDTVPLAFYAGLEFYVIGGTYINDNSPSGTNTSVAPSILLSTDTNNHSAGLLYLVNTVNFGPVVDSALTTPTSGWGTIYEQNVIFEALGSQSPFVLQNFGSAAAFGGLNLTNILVADSNPGFPLVYLKGGTFYSGITVVNSSPTTNSPATVQVADSGSLGNCSGGTAINNAGASIPGCVGGTQNGFQFVGPSTYSNNPPVSFSSWNPPFNFSGSTVQMARAGEQNNSLEIDPLMGDMFGPGGTVGGYDISIARSGAQTLGISLARALPPTGITASPAAGGSLSAGTHVYGVVSAVGASNCNTITNYYLTASMTASGGNLSAAVTWTDPVNTTSVTGYCVLRDPNRTAATQAIFVSGAGATSYTDTGTGGTLASGPVINNTFPASPQYTFGINGAVVPNLTVTGTCTGCNSTAGTVTNTGGPLTANQLVLGNGGNDTTTVGSLGTTTTVYHGNASGAGSFGSVVLTTDVSGCLPNANGGTGNCSSTVAANSWIGNNTGSSGALAPSLIGTSDVTPNECAADTGAVNALVVTLTPPATALANGLEVCFTPANNNTSTTPTLNVSSLGAHTITLPGGGGLITPQFTPAANYIARYNSASGNWELQGGAGSGGGSGIVAPGSQFSFAYYTQNGTSNQVGPINSPTGPNGATYFACSVPAGGTSTVPVFCIPGVSGRTVAGASDTILYTDRTAFPLYTDNAPVAVSVPQAGSTNFGSNFAFVTAYRGNNLATFTPTTSTVNGAANIILGQNQFCFWYSIDNSTYQANCANGNGTIPAVIDTGSANAYVITYPLIQSLQTGATVYFTTPNANTTASTINVSGLGVKNLTKNGAAALVANDLVATKIYQAIYDGTEWQLQNPSNAFFGTFTAHKFYGNDTGSTAVPAAQLIGSSDVSPNWYATDSGAVNAYVVAPTPAVTALTAGATVYFTTANANTGASTLAVSGLTTKSLDKKGATALVAGDILGTPALYMAVYDGTEWQVVNPSSGAGGGGSGTVNNCTITKSVSYYAATGTAVSCISEADLSQYQYVADSGSANAYVLTLTVPLASLTVGNFVSFTTTHANTGASTVNVNSLGVKNITKYGTATLAGGEILSGVVYLLEWDGTEWQILNPSASDFTNVKNFGCLGNGSADDSTCVSNAIASVSGGGTVYFPTSTYVIKSAQTISNNNISIVCEAGAELQQNTATSLFTLTGTNDVVKGCILDGASTGTVAVTVTGAGAINDSIQDNTIQNFAGSSWVLSTQSDGLRITGNRLITGLTASNGIFLNSTAGAITRGLIADNYVTGVMGTGNFNGIGVQNQSGGAITHVIVRGNFVVYSGTGGNTGGFYASNVSGVQAQIQWLNNSCFLSAAANQCYHIYGDNYGVFQGNIANDGGFGAGAGLMVLGDIENSSVTGNVVKITAATGASGAGLWVGDGATEGGEFNTIANNTIDGAGTSASSPSAGLVVSSIADGCGNDAITGNVVRLTHNNTMGIIVQKSGGSGALNCTDVAITGNQVTGTGGATGLNGIEIFIAQTTAATASMSHAAMTGNVVANVATGFLLSSTASTSGTAVAHVDGTNISGDTCDTVTTCVSIVVSTTTAGSTATASNTLISGMVIDGATTGVSTSITSSTGTSTLANTQVGTMRMNGVTTPVSFGGSAERAFTHTVTGSGSLVSGTPSTLVVTLSGPDVFTSSSSYACTPTNLTEQDGPRVTYTSGTSFTITGLNTVTDTVQYVCVGY